MDCLHRLSACTVCMDCLHALSAWNVCMDCLHELSACTVCIDCLHGLSVWTVFMDCLHGLSAWTVCNGLSAWSVCMKNLRFKCITEDYTIKVIDNLENKNSSGHDGISNKLLKTIKGDISQSLAIIINQMLTTGIFPDDF